VTVHGDAAITAFGRKHAQARKPLARFLALALDAEWEHFPAVKETFPATDYVPETGTLIFDVGGNKYRVVARVDFAEQTMFIDSVMTHAEYDREIL
jgi:mRNA interferase HigB